MGEYFITSIFLNKVRKVLTEKFDEFYYINIKNSWSSKTTIKKIKTSRNLEENVCNTHHEQIIGIKNI